MKKELNNKELEIVDYLFHKATFKPLTTDMGEGFNYNHNTSYHEDIYRKHTLSLWISKNQLFVKIIGGDVSGEIEILLYKDNKNIRLKYSPYLDIIVNGTYETNHIKGGWFSTDKLEKLNLSLSISAEFKNCTKEEFFNAMEAAYALQVYTIKKNEDEKLQKLKEMLAPVLNEKQFSIREEAIKYAKRNQLGCTVSLENRTVEFWRDGEPNNINLYSFEQFSKLLDKEK